MSLRFAVGDRVRCKTSATQWKRGTIVALHYREDGWPPGQTAPYQVELQNGPLIYAPKDSEGVIRADDGIEELERSARVFVCQAGPCRRAGGEAVLLEIEELSRSVGGVAVRPSGCLGNCSNAPNVLVVDDQAEQIFARRCDLAASAEVVQRASGRVPSLGDADMVARLARARRLRVRTEAREESKWNLALCGMREDVARAHAEAQAEPTEESADSLQELVQEYAELLAAAGFGDKALEEEWWYLIRMKSPQ